MVPLGKLATIAAFSQILFLISIIYTAIATTPLYYGLGGNLFHRKDVVTKSNALVNEHLRKK